MQEGADAGHSVVSFGLSTPSMIAIGVGAAVGVGCLGVVGWSLMQNGSCFPSSFRCEKPSFQGEHTQRMSSELSK